MKVTRSFSVLGTGRTRRATAVVSAAAIASLLVLGSGAAYGDDGTGTAAGNAAAGSVGAPAAPPASDAPVSDPPATDAPATDAPAAGPTTDAPADTKTDAPAVPSGTASTVKPKSVTAVKTKSQPTTTTAASTASQPKTLAKLVSAPIVNALTVACVGGPGAPVGGFEIDGNTCVQAPVNKDWDNTGVSVVDGFDDATGFTNGTSENDPPLSWSVGGSPNGKTDIGTAWAYSQVSGGNVYGFFAITNNSTSGGTSQYDLEYNQLSPVNNAGGFAVPSRSPGDLLFRFSSTGSNPIVFTDAKKYTLTSSPAWSAGSCFSTTADNSAGWCTMAIPPGVFAQQVNADGTFFEGAINISLLFGAGNCSGSFGSTQIRSVTGNSFATSALKDYVTPIGVSTPSTCGKIVINKQDAQGNPLAGATFSVSPNPDPTQSNATAYSITDNGPKDKNPADGVIEISPVDPNDSYTVTETAAPAGYLLPVPAAQGPTLVGPSQTVTFTFTDPKKWDALTATKTANPTYTASYGWSLVKQIATSPNGPWSDTTSSGSPLTKDVPAAGSPTTGDLYYRVTATEGARTASSYAVSGAISVTNPNSAGVVADISDSLPGATCLVGGDATHHVTVPSGTTPYAYVCTFAGIPSQSELAGTNTGHVSWDKSDYPQNQSDLSDAGANTLSPTATYTFGAETTSINKTVTITDDQHVFAPAQTFTWSQQGTTHTTPTYTQTLSTAPGSCSSVFANTATLTGNGDAGVADDDQVLGTDSAYGKLCAGADLTITRMDAETLTRTYPWSVRKSTTTPKVTVTDGKATADYQVVVTAGDGVDSAWNITGTITVHNPNGWEAVDVTSLPVSYTGGGTCAVTGEAFPVMIPASGSHAFSYSCNFLSQPAYAGTIGATVNWDASAAHTPDGSATDDVAITEADWDKTLVNDSVTVHDDHAAGDDDVVATLDWNTVHAMPGHEQTLTYSVDLQDLPDGGTCTDKVNTVWVVGDNAALLDSDQNVANNSATVQVCNPVGLAVTNSSAGDFTRTYHWAVDKFIDTDQKSQTVHIDSFDHTFDYKVVVTPQERVDSGWVVSGTIGIHNDNTDAAIDPITVTGVSEIPSVGAVTDCVYDTSVPFDLASNASKDVGFTCTVSPTPSNDGAEPPVYGGTTQANVTWGATGTKTTSAAAVGWNAPTEVDKSIAVYDNKVNNVVPVLLGNAEWNAAGTPSVYDYTLNLSVPESTAGSCAEPFDNTAWLGGNGINPTPLQSSAEAVICVNAGTWSVSKVNLAGDGAIPVDSDVTYRLTAHKTGGVNPKNVVLTDDLSALVPFIDGPPQFSTPAGTTVEYDATTHVLTWTIAELGATDQTLDFTVHVSADAYGADLPNLVTSPGSDNCPNADAAAGVAACNTDNDTPHYTLQKASSVAQGGSVLPPYLGDPGTTITYTLTVHNDSDAAINPTTLPGAAVTDDLSDVLDNATFVAGSIDPAGQAELSGNTLTWTLPVIPAGGTAVLTYQVTVNADQWDQTLTNVATPGNGGSCPGLLRFDVALIGGSCTTTSVTPPYTQISALKVDFETGAPLAGAEFALFHGEDQIGTATSGADGVAVFGVKLQPGDFTVTETKAPDGYDLPVGGQATVNVTVQPPGDGSNFVSDGVMAPITFRDPATGQLAITKQHFERDAATNDWVPSDNAVDFGKEIRYVVQVQATGTRLFHDVTLTDYVPGFNPADTTSTADGVLETGTAICSGDFTCTTDEDVATGLVTWTLTSAGQPAGTVAGGTTGTVEFVVRMPDLPTDPPYVNGVYSALLWNQAYLDWNQVVTTPAEQPSLTRAALLALDLPTEAKHLASNEVTDEARAFEPAPPEKPPVVTPPVVKPPVVEPPVVAPLPDTGGPALWILLSGLALALGGTVLVLTDRRPRRRS